MVLEHTLDFGQVTYNGFNFPPALNSSAQCTPVYDDTDRFFASEDENLLPV